MYRDFNYSLLVCAAIRIDMATRWWRWMMLTLVLLPWEVVKLVVARFFSRGMDTFYTKMLGSVMEEIGWSEADYAGSVYCIGYVRQWYRSRVLDIGKEAHRGDTAPNPNVISLTDRKLTKLLDFAREGRPLVLNFGKFRDRADFIIVYIEDPHASDGWRFKNNYDINVHRSIDDRMKAAEELARLRPRCPVVVDTMENVANPAYGGLYERLYVVRDGMVEYEGARGPGGYKLAEVEGWLQEHC
ncbi:IOD1-like protein [Mya arenaria]|uniref:Iodothyronine deiodinase n=1 Tax=Mya arenaria TaxID=6604 RepID=A0ABY7DFJ0_MYAAR|nr:IOD1-like protein [Mya arenaria]